MEFLNSYFFIFFSIFILILFLLLIFFSFMMEKKMKFSSKMEVECGMFNFLNKNSSSLVYLLFLIIFLIFDLEIILFLPMILNKFNLLFILASMIVLMSLIIELFECSLKWND